MGKKSTKFAAVKAKLGAPKIKKASVKPGAKNPFANMPQGPGPTVPQ